MDRLLQVEDDMRLSVVSNRKLLVNVAPSSHLSQILLNSSFYFRHLFCAEQYTFKNKIFPNDCLYVRSKVAAEKVIIFSF